MPEISVVTASSRRRELLLAKLASLEKQTLDPDRFEWLVCVNGPDDGSVAALEAAPPRFALTVLQSDETLAAATARNLAASQAKAPLLLISDDDCLPEPGCLAAHLSLHHAVADAVGVGPVRLPAELRNSAGREPFEQVPTLAGRVLWINATGTNTSLPASAFHLVGGYDESFHSYGGEDPDLAYRLRCAGMTFRHVPNALTYHHGRQLGSEGEEKAYLAGRAHWRVYRKHASIEVGVLLGVHPLLLAVKSLLLDSGPLRRCSGPRLAYERAYLRGARTAQERLADDEMP